MKVALLGATGFVGSAILKEAIDRGHKVTAIRAFEYRGLLEGALEEPRLALTALIGLIGLWPDEAVTFLRRLPPNAESGDLLQIGLELAFPRQYIRN